MQLTIFKLLYGIVTTWLDGKQKKQAAKAELESQIMADKSAWEMYQAQASANSWKDEYWTLVLSLPIVLAFVGVPFCVFVFPEKEALLRQAITQQFQLLEGLPEWYEWAIFASIGAAFGIKGFKTLKGFKK